jgi:transcriptional regulator with XRE-family HTH domain
MTSNETFAKMLDWIFTNTDSKKNVDVAQKTGINETTISRILNGRVKKTKQETLRAVNVAYGNVFNPEWLRGQSDVMLLADLAQTAPEVSTNMHQQAPIVTPDYATMLHVNALIAAKDEAYESLKGKLEAKEETITELHGRLADKDALIKEKDRTINLLQRMLEQMQDSSCNTTHTVLMAAEEES